MLMPGVADTLARERARHDACFGVSNQARIARGQISEAEGLDLTVSAHVGDSARDRDAARAAGIGRFVPAGEFFGWGEP
jgi:hypothetical protein